MENKRKFYYKLEISLYFHFLNTCTNDDYLSIYDSLYCRSKNPSRCKCFMHANPDRCVILDVNTEKELSHAMRKVRSEKLDLHMKNM